MPTNEWYCEGVHLSDRCKPRRRNLGQVPSRVIKRLLLPSWGRLGFVDCWAEEQVISDKFTCSNPPRPLRGSSAENSGVTGGKSDSAEHSQRAVSKLLPPKDRGEIITRKSIPTTSNLNGQSVVASAQL